MAASAIDEAVRNAVCVGADPARIAILDNFCWGYTDRPETLGSLVRAALACHDLAIALETPFISGKDSLNNEFSYVDDQGQKQTISIPPSLLISALGQIADVAQSVTMDLKEAGNQLFQVGLTRDELGGSHWALIHAATGGQVPTVDAAQAKRTFDAVHRAISQGDVRACHDLSEGGLAVSLAEMAFAGGLGAAIRLDEIPHAVEDSTDPAVALLFSESNSRFVCEVRPEHVDRFRQTLADIPLAHLGEVTEPPQLVIRHGGHTRVSASIDTLKEAWQAPLRWH